MSTYIFINEIFSKMVSFTNNMEHFFIVGQNFIQKLEKIETHLCRADEPRLILSP